MVSPDDRNQDSERTEKLGAKARERLRLARDCLERAEQYLAMRDSYPVGRPAVRSALEETLEAFEAYVAVDDPLAIGLEPRGAYLWDLECDIWTTTRAASYCEAFRHEGIYRLTLTSGLHVDTWHRFASLWRQLVSNHDDVSSSTSDVLHEMHTLEHIVVDALDISMARCLGTEVTWTDAHEREDQRVQQLHERLVERLPELNREIPNAGDSRDDTRAEPARALHRLDAMRLEDETRRHLDSIRAHFYHLDDREARDGEACVALLADGSLQEETERRVLRRIESIATHLFRTRPPDEVWRWLKTIHAWHPDLDETTSRRLRQTVEEALHEGGLDRLLPYLVSGDRTARRAIFRLLRALSSDETLRRLVQLLAREPDEALRDEILEYLETRVEETGLHVIGDQLPSLPEETVSSIVEIGVRHMPETRIFLMDLLRLELAPEHHARSLEALRGHWQHPREVRTYLTPLLECDDHELRILAIESVGEGDPDQVSSLIGPRLEQSPPDSEELDALVRVLARHGGESGLESLEDLVRCRGWWVPREERARADAIARALLQVPDDEVLEILETIADDWWVPQTVRSTCREVLELVG